MQRRWIAFGIALFVLLVVVAGARIQSSRPLARPTPLPELGPDLAGWFTSGTPSTTSSDGEAQAPAPTPASEAAASQPLPLEDGTTREEVAAQPRDGRIHNDLLALSGQPTTSRAFEVAAGRRVGISAVSEGSAQQLLSDLAGLGLTDASVGERLVTGRFPVDRIAEASQLPSLRYMRPQWSVRSTGVVDSQGDKAQRSDVLRNDLNLTGAGTIIGILSDSFDCHRGAERDVAADEIPEVRVVKEGPCDGTTFDEGRAMAQIIHDVAPQAGIMFHTAWGGPLEMRDGIRALVEAGANVIVDDIGYPDDPWLQDGVVAQAIDNARLRGVTFLSAAGNNGNQSYEAPFDDAGVEGLTPGSRIHDFDPGPGLDPVQKLTIAPNTIALIVLQWSDNFKTQITNGPAPKTDMDFFAGYGEDLLGASIMPNLTTLEPIEGFLIENPSSQPMPLELLIHKTSGPDPRLVKWVNMQGELRIDEYDTTDATIVGHSGAQSAIAVGAANYRQTPAFGTEPPVVNKYSSRGGTTIVLNDDGEPAGSAFRRHKPEIVAPDGGNTSFFGRDTGADDDRFPNFVGTSAAAPHAAGVAALLRERLPEAGPVDICNALISTAIDMGERKGFDFDSGYGFLDARTAASWLKEPGRKGQCVREPMVVELKIPEPETEPPVQIVPPDVDVVPTPAPPVVSAPPPPPPTPSIPDIPTLAVQQLRVAPGDVIDVMGFNLGGSRSYALALNGERPVGSATTTRDGRLNAKLTLPSDVPDGRYVLTSGNLRSARSFLILARPAVVAGTTIANTATTGDEPKVLDTRTIALLVLFALAIVATIVLWRTSRWM